MVEVAAAPGPRSAAAALLAARRRGTAWTVERHRRPRLARDVERRLVLAAPAFDALVAEQVQSVAQARSAGGLGVPMILRAQNVESDLWSAAAVLERSRLLAGVLRREARLVRAAEAAACREATAVAALTERDAAALRAIAAAAGPIGAGDTAEPTGTAGRVTVVGAPFPGSLPGADRALPGSPALVLLGSGGWLPNRDQATWFVRDVWPAIRADWPQAVLHLFGPAAAGPGIVAHPAPADSREAFAPGSILVVPARIASGLRMKVLEAWARGVAVVSSPAAAEGLGTRDGDALLLARQPEEWSAAVGRLAAEPGLYDATVAAGRRLLATRHAPAAIVAQWESLVAAVESPR